MIDRRRFLRMAGVGLATIPLAEFLAACGDAAAPSATAAPRAMTAQVTPAAASIPAGSATDPATRAANAMPAATVGAICRDAWEAKPSGDGLVPHTIERLTVHHTAALLTDNRKAPAALRSHQRYHQSLGWPDLAYHIAVDANGNIYAGRPTAARGDTATDYDPTGHFLVVAEGDFNAQPISGAQLDGVAAVLAWAAGVFDVDPSSIRGHRDWAATSCPGEAFYALIADDTLRSMVDRHLANGGIDLTVVCDDSAHAAVAAIEAGETPPQLATGATFYLRDSNDAGPADRVIEFGKRGWIPVSGTFEQ